MTQTVTQNNFKRNKKVVITFYFLVDLIFKVVVRNVKIRYLYALWVGRVVAKLLRILNLLWNYIKIRVLHLVFILFSFILVVFIFFSPRSHFESVVYSFYPTNYHQFWCSKVGKEGKVVGTASIDRNDQIEENIVINIGDNNLRMNVVNDVKLHVENYGIVLVIKEEACINV